MNTFRTLPSLLVASSVFLATTLTGCGQTFSPAAAPVVSSERPIAHPLRIGAHTLETVRPASEAETRILESLTQGYGEASDESATYSLQQFTTNPALRAQIQNQPKVMARTIFTALDKNKDGKLKRNELGANANMAAVDKNRDGWASLKEVEAAYAISASELNKKVNETLKLADEVLAVADTNRNRVLTQTEYTAAWNRAFMPAIKKSLQTNGELSIENSTVNNMFKRYASKKGELSREAVAQVIADGSFSVGLGFLMLVLGLTQASK